MAGVTDLFKNRRKALSDALRSGKYGYAGQEQARVDSAPVGSVGAPSGVMPARSVGAGGTGKDPLLDLMTGASFLPGLGDVAGLAADARMYATKPESRTPGNAALTLLGALPFIPSMTVFHGSPHKFDAFDLKHIGKGEGAQAYGHGLYFAESPEVAGQYAKMHEKSAPNAGMLTKLRDAAPKGSGEWKHYDELLKNGMSSLYTVDLPDEAIEKMLDWDAPLSEQPEVLKALKQIPAEKWPVKATADTASKGLHLRESMTGKELHDILSDNPGFAGLLSGASSPVRANPATAGGAMIMQGDRQKEAAQQLRSLGIPGIKYYDGMSRQGGKGTRNFVVFDDKLPKILKRE